MEFEPEFQNFLIYYKREIRKTSMKNWCYTIFQECEVKVQSKGEKTENMRNGYIIIKITTNICIVPCSFQSTFINY